MKGNNKMERLTVKSEVIDGDYRLINPDVERCMAAVNKLGAYEDAEEQGLLYRKIWFINCFCYMPGDCDGDCKYCDMCELEVDDDIIKCSDFNETKHYKTKEAAEQKLAEMKGDE